MNIEQIRKQAQSENTLPDILATLAEHQGSLTQKYVSANPNTPKKILNRYQF